MNCYYDNIFLGFTVVCVVRKADWVYFVRTATSVLFSDPSKIADKIVLIVGEFKM